jgi:hypothetical protein
MSNISTIIEAIESTRSLARFYLSKCKEQDPYKQFIIEGKNFNSLNWNIAHMAWAENMLLIESSGGPGLSYPWFEKVMIGVKNIPASELPPFEESLAAFKAVHEAAIAHLNTLSDEDLIAPNKTGMNFGSLPDLKYTLYHHIRHDAIHIGNIGTLCKLYGLEVV